MPCCSTRYQEKRCQNYLNGFQGQREGCGEGEEGCGEGEGGDGGDGESGQAEGGHVHESGLGLCIGELTNNVDNKEDGTLARLHGEVAAFLVALDRVALGRLHQCVINGSGRAENLGRGIRGQRKDDDDDEKDERVHPVRENRSFKTAEHLFKLRSVFGRGCGGNEPMVRDSAPGAPGASSRQPRSAPVGRKWTPGSLDQQGI